MFFGLLSPPKPRFRFLNPGRLIEGDLELVEPAVRWVGPMVRSAGTGADSVVQQAKRRHLLEAVGLAPHGREPGLPANGKVPAYHYWLRRRPEYRPDTEMAGSIALRIGIGEDLELYLGHLGYGVFPRARGHRYAERACRLLLPLARAHGLREVYLTTNPDNLPSVRTCERLGAEFLGTVDLPPGHPLHHKGERQKRRYRLRVGSA